MPATVKGYGRSPDCQYRKISRHTQYVSCKRLESHAVRWKATGPAPPGLEGKESAALRLCAHFRRLLDRPALQELSGESLQVRRVVGLTIDRDSGELEVGGNFFDQGSRFAGEHVVA